VQERPGGDPRVLWLTGPGGIGKTSLLEAIAEQGEAAGVTSVLRLDARDLPSSPSAALDVVRDALGTPSVSSQLPCQRAGLCSFNFSNKLD
jgi:ABC-type molybdenum transport system ATPase subunit/photorepair protein PhrA